MKRKKKNLRNLRNLRDLKTMCPKNKINVRFLIKYGVKNEKTAGNPWWFHGKFVTLQPFNQKDKKRIYRIVNEK